MRLYVDGGEAGSLSHDLSSLPSTDSPLHVGSDSADGTNGTSVVDPTTRTYGPDERTIAVDLPGGE